MATMFDDPHVPASAALDFARAIAREPGEYTAEEIDDAISCLSRAGMQGATNVHSRWLQDAESLRRHRDAARPTAQPV